MPSNLICFISGICFRSGISRRLANQASLVDFLTKWQLPSPHPYCQAAVECDENGHFSVFGLVMPVGRSPALTACRSWMLRPTAFYSSLAAAQLHRAKKKKGRTVKVRPGMKVQNLQRGTRRTQWEETSDAMRIWVGTDDVSTTWGGPHQPLHRATWAASIVTDRTVFQRGDRCDHCDRHDKGLTSLTRCRRTRPAPAAAPWNSSSCWWRGAYRPSRRPSRISRPPPVSFSPPKAPPISAPDVPMLTLAMPQSEPSTPTGSARPRACRG